MSYDYRKILVFRYGQLGDHLVALPAYWSLREAFPAARLTLLSEVPHDARHLSPDRILPRHGLFDEFRVFHTRAGGRSVGSILRLALDLRRQRFDGLVYLAPRLRTNQRAAQRDLTFFRLAGLRRVLGHRGYQPLPPRQPGQPLPAVRSEVDDLLERLKSAGIPPTKRSNHWLALTEQERSAAKRWLAHHGVQGADRRRCVAIGPGSKWASKIWPEAHFAEAGRRLVTQQDLIPVVLGGGEDAQLGRRLCRAWGRGLVAAGELDVRTAAAAMEGMAGYLGNDTGTMHLAAVAGLRCVGIFAATDWPGKWRPLGGPHAILKTTPECEGCRLEVCPHKNRCLAEVGVDQVLDALEPILRNPLPPVTRRR